MILFRMVVERSRISEFDVKFLDKLEVSRCEGIDYGIVRWY